MSSWKLPELHMAYRAYRQISAGKRRGCRATIQKTYWVVWHTCGGPCTSTTNGGGSSGARSTVGTAHAMQADGMFAAPCFVLQCFQIDKQGMRQK